MSDATDTSSARCRQFLGLLRDAGGEAAVPALFPGIVPAWAAGVARTLDDAGLVERVRVGSGWVYRLTPAGRSAADGGPMRRWATRGGTARSVLVAHDPNSASGAGRRVFRDAPNQS